MSHVADEYYFQLITFQKEFGVTVNEVSSTKQQLQNADPEKLLELRDRTNSMIEFI